MSFTRHWFPCWASCCCSSGVPQMLTYPTASCTFLLPCPHCHSMPSLFGRPSLLLCLQFEWFLKGIASVDRSATPWLLVVMHAPFYSSYAQLWKQNEVGAWLGGHARELWEAASEHFVSH